jgi:hypothetical protein
MSAETFSIRRKMPYLSLLLDFILSSEHFEKDLT